MKLYLKLGKCTYVTREADPEDYWSRDSTSTDWDIENLSLSDGSEYVEISHTPKIGQELYVLYAIYSTGNSFGVDDKSNFEFIDVFEDEISAKSALEEFKNAPKEFDFDDNNVMFTNSSGKKQRFYIPWNGYFESLDLLGVIRLELNP